MEKYVERGIPHKRKVSPSDSWDKYPVVVFPFGDFVFVEEGDRGEGNVKETEDSLNIFRIVVGVSFLLYRKDIESTAGKPFATLPGVNLGNVKEITFEIPVSICDGN